MVNRARTLRTCITDSPIKFANHPVDAFMSRSRQHANEFPDAVSIATNVVLQ